MARRICVMVVFFLGLWVSVVSAAGSASERDRILFQAMQDEMDRNMSELVMEDLQRPYFMAYTIDDLQELDIEASLGTLMRSSLQRSRQAAVEVRVGDPAMDSSNIKSAFLSDMARSTAVAVEDDYDAIRNSLYLATDREYKEALKNLSKKKAYFQGRVAEDRPDDFIEQPANRYKDKAEAFDIDPREFEGLARTVSKVLRDYPMIHSSRVGFTITVENQYFINSEGSVSLRAGRTYTLALSMEAKTDSGEAISDQDRMVFRSLGELPEETELAAWARENADVMAARVAGEEIEEYVGPVIFKEEAAGEFFRQLFVKNIIGLPSPIFDNERYAQMISLPELGNRVKRRVLPAFMDVYDNPTIERVAAGTLAGSFGVDDAGNVPRKIELVKQGKLVGLPIGTAPTKKISEPNGHARGAVGMQVQARTGNVIVESADEIPYDQLVASMLELCADYDLEYGLVIKRLSDPNDRQRRMSFFFGSSSQGSSLTAPVVAYKVYPDGREVPVRNLEFNNVTLRTLRDILQTGREAYVYNYLVGNNTELPSSIVSPALLVEEMELTKSEGTATKLPALSSPLSGE